MNGSPENYDVCVVGAGFGGIAASVTLARLGLKTVLIEKSPRLGGVAHTGMHQELCGLYGNGEGLPRQTLNAGLSREVAARLLSIKGSAIRNMGRVAVLRCDPQELTTVLSDMVTAERNLDILFESGVEALQVENQAINRIDIRSEGRTRSLGVRAVIDGSAGDVVRLSGAGYALAPAGERQLVAYAVGIGNITVTGDPKILGLKLAYHLSKAAENGEIAPVLRYSVWLEGRTAGEGVLRISVLPSDSGYNLDVVRNDAVRVHDLMKAKISEFKVSKMGGMAPAVSEREGIRMTGRYCLVAADVVEGRKFEDGCVKSAWPIEFWHQRKGPQYHHVPDRDYYEIPTRCLQSKDVGNLFAAGRCISTDPKALASARVTGTCLATGEQSARAASAHLAMTSGRGRSENVGDPRIFCR